MSKYRDGDDGACRQGKREVDVDKSIIGNERVCLMMSVGKITIVPWVKRENKKMGTEVVLNQTDR